MPVKMTHENPCVMLNCKVHPVHGVCTNMYMHVHVHAPVQPHAQIHVHGQFHAALLSVILVHVVVCTLPAAVVVANGD